MREALDVLMELVGHVLLLTARLFKPTPTPPLRVALAAALTARNAVIEGDTAAIDAFSRTWLGLSRPERWRAAVEMALLGDWVDALGRGAATDQYVLSLLRRHTDNEHRALQPLWERRVRGKRTVLLGQPLGTDLTVQDLLVDHHTPEAEVLGELADSRLFTVLQGLDADENTLAKTWAASRDTWAEAALAAELPTECGERVRRKLKRLGRRYEERRTNASTVVAMPAPGQAMYGDGGCGGSPEAV
ncbi:hypothetical protein [Streptomyces sp. C3-3]|uniref:hypothetical protein n=1 Tax=Streptomyces sp. C3-3 TaxID=2824901 RepID=UPI001B36A6DE|nr:hypothetical protein [Streptomyces sp. C3-3]MBQ1116994.1 hypothetical protein [Streptomyces sp. C3-3]